MGLINTLTPSYQRQPVANRFGMRDDLLVDCDQLELLPNESISVPVQSVSATDLLGIQATPVNDNLGLPWVWNGGEDSQQYNPNAYTTVSESDTSSAIARCNVTGQDEILKAACICSYLANRAVINEDPVNHAWFTDDQGYQKIFFDQIFRAYVAAATQGTTKKPSIQFYTKDPEGVITYLKSIFQSQYTENYIRVAMYWLKRTWGTVVHPAVMEPTTANLSNSSDIAKNYNGNQEALIKGADKENCMYFGIDFCQIGSAVKWILVLGGLGLLAYIIWNVSSFIPKKS